MNRFTTVLYPALPTLPALPSSASDSASTYHSRESPRLTSPLDAHFHAPASDIYADPRRTTVREGSPRPVGNVGGAGTELGLGVHKDGAPRKRGRQARADLSKGKGGLRVGAMAKGPGGRWAVGGGQYLRIIHVSGPDGIVPAPAMPIAHGSGGVVVSEVVNLWKGSWSAGKSINDVDWAAGGYDHKVLTASMNGNFMIFDLNRARLEREVGGGHPRPMNCIRACKTPAYAHMLLTGGTEGQARLWDMREAQPANRKYYKHNAPVTSLCFCPDDPHHFVVGLDNGAILRYDYRTTAKAVGKVWGAHGSKAVVDLQWKEETGGGLSATAGKGWLASAGADRTVQVWDMGATWDKAAQPTHTLHASAPVRKVAWRPGRSTEIALALDGDAADDIEIWDVRRHYLPKYLLGGGVSAGPAVDVAWDADTAVALYQDGVLAQHEGGRIVEVDRQVVAWSPRDEVVYAIDRFKSGEIPFDDLKPEYSAHYGQIGRRPKDVGDAAYEPLQAVGVMPFGDMDESDFAYLAHHYRLEGDDASALCRWNCEIAEVAGKDDEAQIWTFVKQLIDDFSAGAFNEGVFSQTIAQAARMESPPSPGGDARGVPLLRDDDADASSSSGESDSYSESESDDAADTVRPRFQTFRPAPTRTSSVATVVAVPPLSRAASSAIPTVTPSASVALAHAAMLGTSVSASPVVTLGSLQQPAAPAPASAAATAALSSSATSARRRATEDDYPDPYGIAFAGGSTPGSRARSALASARASPAPDRERTLGMSSLAGSVVLRKDRRGSAVGKDAKDREDRRERDRAREREEYRRARERQVVEWWRCYADDGEAQLAASLAIVAAAAVEFPPAQTERVVHAYLDQLDRHRLAGPAAYVRRHAGLLSVQTLAQHDGITHILHCVRCGKPTGSLEDAGTDKRFWWCTRCRAAIACAICHAPVLGLFLGCNACHHGGHQRCMRLYFVETERQGSTLASTSASAAATATATTATTPAPSAAPLTLPPTPTPDTDSAFPSTLASGAAGTATPVLGLGGASASALDLAAHARRDARDGRDRDRDRDVKDRDGNGRDARDRDGASEGEAEGGWNVCPAGCGCRCRTFR
ncbi:SEA (Seh1-associated) complex subunit [Cryptotrichosporon argae]